VQLRGCDVVALKVEDAAPKIDNRSIFLPLGTMDPVAVELSGGVVVEVTVPNVLGALGQRDALDLAAAVAVEQAELDPLGAGREQREIRSAPVPGGAQGVRRTGRKPHATAPG
jgi:hypothetical protein